MKNPGPADWSLPTRGVFGVPRRPPEGRIGYNGGSRTLANEFTAAGGLRLVFHKSLGGGADGKPRLDDAELVGRQLARVHCAILDWRLGRQDMNRQRHR
jgi:hypothetical protein